MNQSAIHEAGHALYGTFMRERIVSASLNPPHVLLGPPPRHYSKFAHAQLAFYLAGAAAEWIMDFRPSLGGGDYRDAIFWARKAYEPARRVELLAFRTDLALRREFRTLEFLARFGQGVSSTLSQHRPALLRLANALEDRGFLTGKEIYALAADKE